MVSRADSAAYRVAHDGLPSGTASMGGMDGNAMLRVMGHDDPNDVSSQVALNREDFFLRRTLPDTESLRVQAATEIVGMTIENLLWPTTVALPMAFTKKLSETYRLVVMDGPIAGQVPNEGIVRQIETGSSKFSVSSIRYGLGARFENERLGTPEGRQDWEVKLDQLALVFIQNAAHDAMGALRNPSVDGADYFEAWKVDTLADMVAYADREIREFGAVQKASTTFLKMVDEGIRRIQRRGLTKPNMMVGERGLKAFFAFDNPQTRDYELAGPKGAIRLQTGEMEGLFQGLDYYVPPVYGDAFDDKLCESMLDNYVVIGNFFKMQNKYLHMGANYSSAMIDFKIYDEDNDDWALIAASEVLCHSNRFDENGQLAPEHFDLAAEFSSDDHRDVFIYNAGDSVFRVARAFGNMESAYLPRALLHQIAVTACKGFRDLEGVNAGDAGAQADFVEHLSARFGGAANPALSDAKAFFANFATNAVPPATETPSASAQVGDLSAFVAFNKTYMNLATDPKAAIHAREVGSLYEHVQQTDQAQAVKMAKQLFGLSKMTKIEDIDAYVMEAVKVAEAVFGNKTDNKAMLQELLELDVPNQPPALDVKPKGLTPDSDYDGYYLTPESGYTEAALWDADAKKKLKANPAPPRLIALKDQGQYFYQRTADDNEPECDVDHAHFPLRHKSYVRKVQETYFDEQNMAVRAARIAFLSAPITYQVLEAMLQHDVAFPVDGLIVRPFMSYRMSSVYLLAGGRELGQTNYGYLDVSVGGDAATKVTQIGATWWMKAFVRNVRRIAHLNNVFYNGCRGGAGARFGTLAEIHDAAQSNFIDVHENGRSFSLMAMLVPHGSLRTAVRDISVRGRYTGYEDRVRGDHYIGWRYYEKKYHLDRIMSPYMEQPDRYTRTGHVNEMCLQGTQFNNTTEPMTFAERVQNKGHHGPYEYPGCQAVRNGAGVIQPERMPERV